MVRTRSSCAHAFFVAIATASFPAACRHVARPSAARPNAGQASNDCTIVPLQLTFETPGQPTVTFIGLDGQGALRSGLSGTGRAPLGVLDSRGCLVVSGDTEAEVTARGDVWTRTTLYEFEGNTLCFPNGRTIRLAADGTIETRGAAGAIEAYGATRMAIVGDIVRGACAARVLLAVWMESVPSMAASDGVLPVLPPPAGSRCPHRPRDASR